MVYKNVIHYCAIFEDGKGSRVSACNKTFGHTDYNNNNDGTDNNKDGTYDYNDDRMDNQ